MHIKQITLKDYRIYNGKNILNFPKDLNKNVFIVSGNNGFGKTTLLTSLVWVLYGKLMVDVDEKFRREIYDAGGYKKYAHLNFNRLSRSKYEELLFLE
jgi:DNA sulfur modification protein DndD